MSADTLGLFDWFQRTIWTNSIATIILAPVVLLLCRVFQRRPAVQHLLWLLLLVKFMTPQVPGFAWVIPESIVGYRWQQESHDLHGRITRDIGFTSSVGHVVEPAEAMTVAESINRAEATDDIAESIQPAIAFSVERLVEMVVLGAWVIGAGYFLIVILLGLRKQRCILRRTTAPGPRLSEVVNEVADGLGLRRLVSVVSPDIRSPFISFLGYVRLVWPKSLSASDPTTLRSLIAHEAAHVRRLDHYVAWLELTATILWWWNPVFWFVRHRLRVSAEMACDAIALDAFPEDRCIYAEKLLELSTCYKTGAPPLVLAVGGGTPSSIERRIAMIVSDRVSCKTSALAFLLIGIVGLSILPSWTFAQNVPNPPPPEPISWLLTPFLRQDPPAPQPNNIQQPAAPPAPVALNNEEKMLLRLKAMYLLAISENRTNDAEALAAAITAMTLNQAREGHANSSAVPDDADPVKEERGGSRRGGGADAGGMPGESTPGNAGGLPLPDLDHTDMIQDLGPRKHWLSEKLNLFNFQAISELRAYPGLVVRLKVTGANDGMVWGSNAYTDDSSVNTAALHAGLVRPGETAEVAVIIRPGMEGYGGSESHGILSHSFGPFQGSFQLAPAVQYPEVPYLGDRRALRGNSDAYLSLNMLSGLAPLKPGVTLIVPLLGKSGGPIFGTDQYASDGSLDAAAVHAGVLKEGEFGFVKIILAEGLESYAGSNRNNLESQPYGKTKLSLRFEKVSTIGSDDGRPSPTSGGGGVSGAGGGSPPGDIHPLGLPNSSDPSGAGAPSAVVEPGMPPVAQEFQLDRRKYLGRDPGPRRNWQVEPQASGGSPLQSQILQAPGNDAGGDSPPINQQEQGNYGSGGSDRTEIIRDLGPRRNWAVERYNLHRSLALGQFRSHEGLAVRIRVTGEKDGLVWGTNPYSDDSSLHSAALHSGLVKQGQTTDVVAIIRPGQASYAGSESYGITSHDHGDYPGSFELVPISQCPDAPYLCDRYALRNSSDNYLSLNKLAGQAQLKPGVSLIVPLHAKAGAPIVGTDQYASDNNLDATAIHAGVLKDGESGYVKIILDEGLDSYTGTERNGVESYPYGKTRMSMRFEKLSVQQNNSQPALSLNEQRLRAVELITDGLGTAFVEVDVINAIEATSEAGKTEPSTDGPGLPNARASDEQPPEFK